MNALRTLAVVAATLIGCLPEDTREEPGALMVNIRGTDATVDGFDTTDGFHVTFERVIVSVGAPNLGREDACSPYSDGEYLRVIDGMRREPEKLGLLYGLGSCGLDLRAGNPGSEALLGVGVTEETKSLMRDPGSDAHEQDAGITYWIVGRAVRGSEQKSFDWRYRTPRLRYSKCALPAPIVLTGGASLVAEVRVHAPALFEDGFARFATADADGDGAITFDELDRAGIGDAVYNDLFPRIIRIGDDGLCEVDARGFRGPD